MKHKPLLLFLIFFVLQYVYGQDKKPNIVFVMVDDLGAEQIGAYGGESYKTPNIDKLATKGMLFNNMFAQPMCQISRATLMSGKYGFRVGFRANNNAPLVTKEGWGKDQPTVATLLKDAGYTTMISGKWHLAHFDHHPDHLTEQGFDYQNAWAHVYDGERTRRYWESTYFREKKIVKDGPGIYGPDQFCKYVTDFITKHKGDDKPFFAYYPMVMVHFPVPQTPDNINEPQPGWKPEDNLRIAENWKWSAPNYKSMLEYTDKLVGRIVDKIEDLGIAENTLVIFTADNGSWGRTSCIYNGKKMKGEKGKVTDGGTRVPFIAYWKGKVKPGSVSDNLVDFTDILPTLTKLGGGKLPADQKLDGMSFHEHLLGQEKAPKRDWVFMGNGQKAMIRADKFSLDAAGNFYDLQKNRYKPELVPKGSYTEIHQGYYKMLSQAMDSLGHPFKGGLEKAKKKNKKEKK